MIRKRPISIVATTIVALAVCGCWSSDRSEHRYVNKAQGYAVDQPDGWSVSIVRGFAQFAPKPDMDKTKKHTIIVRAADMPREFHEGKPATTEEIVIATEKVLGAMPRAKLGERRAVETDELRGARISLTFVPSGLTTRYRREHVVLFGDRSKHLFHVIYTAPASEAIDEAAFKQIVNTLSEEG